MREAIGLIETVSIAIGISVTDEMAKTADVEVLESTAICPGKYMVLIAGDVSSVESSLKRGVETGGDVVVDTLFIPHVHPQVFPAILGATEVEDLRALGIVETFTVASSILAADAAAKAARGDIELSPCHHHGAVGPMAGVTSPSMPVAVVTDAAGDGVAYSTLNEGLGKVLRYGAFGPEAIDRLHWMDEVLGPVLSAVLESRGPIDLQSLIAQALQMGDDGHNRNRAVTSLFLREIAGSLIDGADATLDQRREVFNFIEGNDHFMLNLVMAAGKLGSDAASGVPASSLVTVMARNGTDFGIRLSGTGDEWFIAPAPPVDGLYLGSFTEEDASPDIGDSTITETVGLGGLAMAAAPAIVGFVGGTAAGAVRRTLAMYEITMAEHPMYQIPMLEFRGTPVGIDAARVVRTEVLPQINTGVAGKVPGTGMVGAGLVEAPIECFAQGINALAVTLQ